jgi:ABC-type multidrug transport system fused ATPase/permease subunit
LRLGRAHAGLIAVSTLCLLAATAADVWLLVLFRRYVDRSVAAPAPGLLGLVLLALVITAARSAAAYVGARLAAQASTTLVADLEEKLFGHLQGLSLEFFQRSRPGDLVSRIFHDVEAAARLVTGVTSIALEAPVRLVVMFAAVWSLHARMAFLMTVVLVPAVILERLLGRTLRRRFRDLYEDVAAFYEAVQESLGAVELVKSFGREPQEIEGFRARTRVRVEKEKGLDDLQAAEEPGGHALRLVALIGVIAYGTQEVAAGRLTPGALAATLLASYALLGSLQSLAGLYSGAQAGLAAAERVFAVLDETPSVAPPARGRKPTFDTALRFEGVTFAYPGRPHGLEGVDFSIRPGERVAVAGRTGSGKTTLLRLALRLYDPTAGRVTLDGVDLRELELEELRRLFAVVPQDVLLFDRTITQNIAFGRPDAGRERLEATAGLVGLDGLAARLPNGLDTAVGTRAVTLSAGERQRIALARAMIREAPILLLDEATSALDSQTEGEIQAALDRFTEGRTVIMVAHRLSTLRAAERVLVLDAGRVSADGTHDELMRQGGLYRRICEAQGERSEP